MIRGIIFDFDGTLVDSNEIHIEGFKHALRHHRISLGSKEIIEMFGIPGEQILEKLTPLAPEVIKDVMADKRDFCDKLIKKKGFPEESRRVLEGLKSMGYKTAIVTGSHEKFIRSVVPVELVDVLYTSDSGLAPKPSAEMLLAASRDMNIEPDKCVYIGDSANDMKSAVNAGMKFIAVKSDLTWEGLRVLDPEISIDHMHEILDIFDEYPKDLDSIAPVSARR